jgi:hypothetical protein
MPTPLRDAGSSLIVDWSPPGPRRTAHGDMCYKKERIRRDLHVDSFMRSV